MRRSSKLIILGLGLLFAAFVLPIPEQITMNSDDGTEVNQHDWYEDGVSAFSDRIGNYYSDEYIAGFRFFPDDLNRGEQIAYARLKFSSTGCWMTSSIDLLIEGVLQESPTTFSAAERPSQKTPKTLGHILWTISEPWIEGDPSMPYGCFSPDISPVINEILRLPEWGSGVEGKSLILTVKGRKPVKASEANCAFFRDFRAGNQTMKSPVTLETYRSVYDTFLGRECLGRVTDRSVTINLYSLLDTDLYIEYGTLPGYDYDETPIYAGQPAEKPIEIVLQALLPDTQYFYRLRYRKASEGTFEKGERHSFRTQREKGAPFVFAIQADEHLQAMYRLPESPDEQKLYQITLQNMAESRPDFFISLGDFAHTEYASGRNAQTLQEAMERYLLQRRYIDEISHSVPFFLVLGNHEGEQGWHRFRPDDDGHNLAHMSIQARKSIIPNPIPDRFYSGNRELTADIGLREDYFAWIWGDALFIALSPYWQTVQKPYPSAAGISGWEWTLGKQQYDWLYETLHAGQARWKFVFIHQLVSTDHSGYGRGGIEIAKFKVAHKPSYEWGGEDENGNYIFDTMRPEWRRGPIHDLLLDAGVDVVFHGHDHFFARQELDTILYLECPQPGDANYTFGYKKTGKYEFGEFIENSGHIQVRVEPDRITIEYVRAYLPGDGQNGEVAYREVLTKQSESE
ncbi:MAG: metallophosphoesterase [Planctomycetota bacterium]